jgi:RHS repeat-associated protein
VVLAVLLLPLGVGLRRVEAPTSLPGQSATLLPDGRWLLLGGEGSRGAVDTAEIWDPRTGLTTPLAQDLHHRRAWHSATVMPDGSVLVLGGLRQGRVVEPVERIWPGQTRVEDLGAIGPDARAAHTATVLMDGRVLLAGGRTARGVVETLEVWNPDTGELAVVGRLGVPRWRHTASLQASGEVVLWGGRDAAGTPLDTGEQYDPATQALTPLLSRPGPDTGPPGLVASSPPDGATDVATASLVALRFSSPVDPAIVTDQSVFLTGDHGSQAAQVVAAEAGRLVFLTADTHLLPGTRYTVTMSGLADPAGRPVPFMVVSFQTADSPMAGPPGGPPTGPPSPPGTPGPAPDDDEDWSPRGPDGRRDWRHGGPPSRWETLPPLEADAGTTALAGRVLKLNGDPLANVTLIVENRRTRTDRTGRFLLRGLSAGHHELLIDGRTANRPGRTYGIFEVGVDVSDGSTTVLPYTIWMPKLDTAHAVRIPSPTPREIVVTTPRIPGLEVRIPAGTVIRDHEGRTVREVSITPMSLDRPPFPVPGVPGVPAYFTVQPGGAYLYNPQHLGARLVYPNTHGEPFGARHAAWHYDPGDRGWHIYGHATVTADERQIRPEPGTAVYKLTGAMLGCRCYGGPPTGPGLRLGEPVETSTGAFVHEKTDLALPDVIPIVLRRTYRASDARIRGFGRGATHPYDILLVGNSVGYGSAEVILADGFQLQYVRITPGTDPYSAVLEHTTSPTPFYKSRLSWNGNGWDLTLKDGTVYVFPDGYTAPTPAGTALLRIKDRFGNTLRIHREPGTGNIRAITSPHGRSIRFTYDSTRIVEARDNLGRTVSYTYDASARLWKVTDAAGGVTEYTYDVAHRMLTIKDPRGIVFLTNEYDVFNERVTRQTQADGTTFQFAYTVDGTGRIVQTDVTDPRGYVERLTFNGNGHLLTHVRALGQPEQQTTTYELEVGTNFPTTVIDALGRRTTYAYDEKRNVTGVTRLANTPDAVTTTYTYEPTFNQMSSVTDPLSHTTSFGYDAQGRLTTITNPLNQQTVITPNAAGQPVSVRDPLDNTTVMTYEAGDLVTVADPLGSTTRRFVDGAGRVVAVTDPLGRTTRYQYDPLSRLTQITDPKGGITAVTYDGNSNLLGVMDARSNTTSYTYNDMDRLITRSDPLTRQEHYQYDNNGNVTQFTDRKSQVTAYTYDGLNRQTQVTYADNSTTIYTFDAGNRLTGVIDSIGGTVTRTYNGLDGLIQEASPQGTVTYTYDGARRRTNMTVAGQLAVGYTYDNADRLTQITQGSSSVGFGYDAGFRRTSLTLPNGIVVESAYDNASRLTGLTYKLGPTTLGTLSYAHDAAGERAQVGGTWARTGLPQAVATASYDASNQQLSFGGETMTFDPNGNLATRVDGSGTTTYTWNARDELTALSGPGLMASFGYDGLGRRWTKTINGAQFDFLYDGLNPVQEGLLPSTPTANLLTGLGLDEFLTRTDTAGVRALLSDALGSTLALGDASGAVQTEYTYEPFGAATQSGASSTNSFQFAGRENDGTGLYYNRARYYNATRQRFISEDPAGEDANAYAYVNNAPLTHVDPTGLSATTLPIPIPLPWIPPVVPVIVGGGVAAAGGWTVGQIIGSAIASRINTDAAPPARARCEPTCTLTEKMKNGALFICNYQCTDGTNPTRLSYAGCPCSDGKPCPKSNIYAGGTSKPGKMPKIPGDRRWHGHDKL